MMWGPVLVGDFQSKCLGPHPGGRVGKMMEMLTEVWTRVDLVFSQIILVLVLYKKDTLIHL